MATSAAFPPPDRDTFAELYGREFDLVSRWLKRFGIPDRDLPDVVHDVFFTTYRAFHRYDSNRPFRAWLFGVAHRVASDYRRLGRNTEVLDPRLQTDGATVSPDRLIDAFDHWRISERSLAQMGLRHGAVLLMHDFFGYEAREIARALNIVEKTVYSRLRTARLRFQRLAANDVERGTPGEIVARLAR